MAIALVTGQSATTDFAAVSPISVVLPNNPTTNNFVAVIVAFNQTPAPPGLSIKDANNNVYVPTAQTPITGNGSVAGIYYLANAPANALKTITMSWTGGGSFPGDVWALEFSGVSTSSPFENDATALPPSGPTYTTPSYTTVHDGDLLLSGAASAGTISGVGSPWTAAAGIPTVNGNGAEFFIQTTHGAQAVAYTLSSQNAGAAIIAAFSTVSNAVAAKGGMLPLLGVG